MKRKPDRVQSVLQSLLPRLTMDELLNNLQLAFTTSLKAAGVVENVTVVVYEDEFVLNVMLATLEADAQAHDQQSRIRCRADLCRRVKLNLAG